MVAAKQIWPVPDAEEVSEAPATSIVPDDCEASIVKSIVSENVADGINRHVTRISETRQFLMTATRVGNGILNRESILVYRASSRHPIYSFRKG